jgi:hypothetical protein
VLPIEKEATSFDGSEIELFGISAVTWKDVLLRTLTSGAVIDEQSPSDNIAQKSEGIDTEDCVEESVEGISISCIPVAIAFSSAVITAVVVVDSGVTTVVVVVSAVVVVVEAVAVVVEAVAVVVAVVSVFFFVAVVEGTDVDGVDCVDAFSVFPAMVLVVELVDFFLLLCSIVGVVNIAVM